MKLFNLGYKLNTNQVVAIVLALAFIVITLASFTGYIGDYNTARACYFIGSMYAFNLAIAAGIDQYDLEERVFRKSLLEVQKISALCMTGIYLFSCFIEIYHNPAKSLYSPTWFTAILIGVLAFTTVGYFEKKKTAALSRHSH